MSDRQLKKLNITPETELPAEHPDEGWDYHIGKSGLDSWKPDLNKHIDEEHTPAVEVVAEIEKPKWEKLPGSKLGTNAGGLFKGPDGKTHYVKFYDDEDQARSEYAANKLTEALGLPTPKVLLETIEFDGKKRLGFASEWMDDLKPVGGFDVKRLSKTDKTALTKQYLNAALLNNWDVVGFNLENLVKAGKKWLCVDAGGAFDFKATGGKKIFEKIADAFETLLAPGRKAEKIFGPIVGETVQAEPEKYAKWLGRLSDKKIRTIIREAGLDENIAETIIGRKKDILSRLKPKVYQGRFKSPEHNARFDTFYEEFKGLSEKEIRNKLKKECPVIIDSILHEWRGSAQAKRPIALKRLAERLETRKLKTFWRSEYSVEEIDHTADEIPIDEYIRIRAATRAYYDDLKIQRIKRYRGTDGRRSGPAYNKKIKKLRRDNPKNWETISITMDETSITGWTQNKAVANGFGHHAGGITQWEEFNIEDVFLPHEIWFKNSFHHEMEDLIFGEPVRTVSLSKVEI